MRLNTFTRECHSRCQGKCLTLKTMAWAMNESMQVIRNLGNFKVKGEA